MKNLLDFFVELFASVFGKKAEKAKPELSGSKEYGWLPEHYHPDPPEIGKWRFSPENPVQKTIQIIDYRDKLPSHPTKRWARRKKNPVKIIVHQEAGEGSLEAVNKYHITASSNNHIAPEGAPKIAYHYVIRGPFSDEDDKKDGDIIWVNDIESIVWHCKGQNQASIGILLEGDFDGKNHIVDIGDGSPTSNQLISLGEILNYLTEQYGILKSEIYGHCDFGKAACPGYDVYEFIGKYKQEYGN